MKVVTRIYQAIPLAIADKIPLDDGKSHHLIHVLRVQKGDHVSLFNGQDGEYPAVITQIQQKKVWVEILSFSPQTVESPLNIHLVQGIARGEKMDFIVQKAVELGVTTITPLITERCNVKLDLLRSKKRENHWQAIAISATEQCGRNQIPTILSPIAIKDWWQEVMQKETTGETSRYILLPDSSYPHVLDRLKQNHHEFKSVTILIGPEGGLSGQEASTAIAHGFIPLNLGPRILRTETAAIASIAILQYCFGDMGG